VRDEKMLEKLATHDV
jgi:hypothetical protein